MMTTSSRVTISETTAKNRGAISKATFDSDTGRTTNLSLKEEKDLKLTPTEKLASRGMQYLESAMFAITAALVFWHLDVWALVTASREHDQLNRIWFNAGLVCTAGYVIVFTYVAVWLNGRRNIPIEYEKMQLHAPGVIPAGTGLVIASGVMFTVAFWPVWHFTTIPILTVEFLGFVAAISLVV